MYPTEVPIVNIYAGDDVQFPVFRLMEGTPPAPVDLSAYTNWAAEWRSDPNSETKLLLVVDTAELAAGKITITADHTVTNAMNGSGWWDVQAELGGNIRTFLLGRTSWTKDVTRD